MDVNDLRVVVMLLGLVLFLGIWVWAWSARRRTAFDEAAHLPFLDDDAGRDARTGLPQRRAASAGAVAAGTTPGDAA